MKNTIIEEVLHRVGEKPIQLKDTRPFIFEDNDIIEAGHDEGFYSENESWDPHYYFIVKRERLETDEEYEKRLKKEAEYKKYLRERRYQNYLKLKEEFEPKTEEK